MIMSDQNTTEMTPKTFSVLTGTGWGSAGLKIVCRA